MPNLHRARFALPATLIAALVAGCGGGSSGGTANTTSTTSGTTTATTTSTTTSTGSGSTSTTATPTAAAGIVTLANANFAATASTGSVTVTAVRQGGSSGEATVSYTTVNGTAIAGTDYTATSGTLTWTDGDAAPKTFTVPVSIQDLGTKTFTVQLAHATDASLGTTASARVTILGRALTSKNTGGTGATTSTGSSTTGTSTTGSSTTSGTTSTGTTSGTSGTTSTGTTSTTSSGSTTASGSTFWVYYNGVFNWPGDYSYVASIDYKDTSGAPLSGGADIKVSLTGAYGAWQPYSTNWSFDSSPYTKLTFALKPTSANDRWQIQFIKVGDIPVGISLNVLNYGPAPVVGQWGVYTIPLADLGVLGTSIYKFAIQDESGNGGSVFYVDNVGFVP